MRGPHRVPKAAEENDHQQEPAARQEVGHAVVQEELHQRRAGVAQASPRRHVRPLLRGQGQGEVVRSDAVLVAVERRCGP